MVTKDTYITASSYLVSTQAETPSLPLHIHTHTHTHTHTYTLTHTYTHTQRERERERERRAESIPLCAHRESGTNPETQREGCLLHQSPSEPRRRWRMMWPSAQSSQAQE